MEFRTLRPLTLEELAAAFNKAFEGYFVPVHMTPDQLRDKIKTEGIDRELSVGAFDGNRLQGFILHGIGNEQGKRTAYNAGTGVIEEARGRRLTIRLYDHIFPQLREAGIEQCLLEVIKQNVPAIRSYQSCGFRLTRELTCFKRKRITTPKSKTIIPLEQVEKADLRSFWDWEPTWQNGTGSMMRGEALTKTIGLDIDGSLAAYATFNPGSGRVHQFAVRNEHRRKGLGTELFSAISAFTEKDLTIINVDASASGTLSALEKMGFSPFLQQLEMRLEL